MYLQQHALDSEQLGGAARRFGSYAWTPRFWTRSSSTTIEVARNPAQALLDPDHHRVRPDKRLNTG
jgi:hypothetical protein